jgi:ABC-type glycerol-3-phosphate transport system substrate-binding protein
MRSTQGTLLCLVFVLIMTSFMVSYAAQPVELTVYMGYDSASPDAITAVESIIAEYEALNPHVKINNLGRQENADVLLTHIAGGTVPDMVKGGMTMLLTMHMAGVLDPVPAAFADKIRQNFFPVATDSVTFDGKLIAVPMEGNSTALVFNQRLLGEKGIAEIPKTWEQFAQLGRRLTEYESDGKIKTPAVVEPGVDWSLCYIVLGMLKSEGAQILDAEGKLTLNSPEAKRAVQHLTSALSEKPFMQLGWGGHGRFNQGEIPFGLGLPWWLNANNVTNITEYRTTLIPAGSMGYGSAFYSHGYAIPKFSQNKEEAWRFLEWLALREKRNEGTPLGQIAAKVGVLPITRSDVASSHFAHTRQYHTGFMESLNYAVHPSTFLQYGLSNWTIIAKLASDTGVRGIAPDTVFENISTQLNAKLEEAIRTKGN